VRNYDLATFLKSLSLLVQHETPLHEAVLLAGYSTGNRHIIADATTVAQRLREGQPLEKALESTARLPGFLKWMFRSGRDAGSMQETLELTADIYQKRASRRAELLQTVLPVVLTAGLAGTLTLVYCLMLFAPIHELYSKLGEPLK